MELDKMRVFFILYNIIYSKSTRISWNEFEFYGGE